MKPTGVMLPKGHPLDKEKIKCFSRQVGFGYKDDSFCGYEFKK
jgi:hypothetical protein